MNAERLAVWLLAVAVCLAFAVTDGGLSRPASAWGLFALGALAALPLAVVFGRALLSFGPAKRGWR